MMRLHVCTDLLKQMLLLWQGELCVMDSIFSDPAFQAAKTHAQDFRGAMLSDESYLHELMHVNGHETAAYRKEIGRNADLIKKADMGEVISQVMRYAPLECLPKEDVEIHLIPGIGGLAIDRMILLDPTPFPWYPQDGSDPSGYLDGFILPTIRHELHHICYRAFRQDRLISELQTRKLLAEDYALQLQMEGSAVMCEALCDENGFANEDAAGLMAELKQCAAQVEVWLKHGDSPVQPDDWTEYYALWNRNKLVYRVGKYAFQAMLKRGISVSEAIGIPPLEWLAMAVDVWEKT